MSGKKIDNKRLRAWQHDTIRPVPSGESRLMPADPSAHLDRVSVGDTAEGEIILSVEQVRDLTILIDGYHVRQQLHKIAGKSKRIGTSLEDNKIVLYKLFFESIERSISEHYRFEGVLMYHFVVWDADISDQDLGGPNFRAWARRKAEQAGKTDESDILQSVTAREEMYRSHQRSALPTATLKNVTIEWRFLPLLMEDQPRQSGIDARIAADLIGYAYAGTDVLLISADADYYQAIRVANLVCGENRVDQASFVIAQAKDSPFFSSARRCFKIQYNHQEAFDVVERDGVTSPQSWSD